MPNPWEQDWGGNTATESAPAGGDTPPLQRDVAASLRAPWEQSWSDSPADKPRPTVALEPVPGYLKVAARADSGVRKAGLNIMRMADAVQDFFGLPGAVTAVTGNDTYEKAIAGNLNYYNAREAQLSQQDAALDNNSVAGQFVEGLARGVTELPVQLIPGAAARNVAQAVKISAGTAGAIGGLSSYGQDVGAGKSRAEAVPYAIASGGITALTTAAFGSSGVESIFKEKVAGTLREKIKSVLVGIGMEATEEMVDQAQQDFIERVDRNPDKPVAESFKDVLMAGGIGGVIGGGVSAVGQVGMPTRGNTEAKTLEAELRGEVGTQESTKAAAKPWEVDFQSGLNEAPATGTASPVERFIYEEKGRRSQTAATTAAEPMPWEMEYAGGEMAGESSKFEGSSVKISPAAQEMPAPTLTAPSRAVETTQAASADAAGVKPSAKADVTESPRKPSLASNVQTGTEMPVQPKPNHKGRAAGAAISKVEIKVKNPYGLAPEAEKIQHVIGTPITLKGAPGHEFVVYRPTSGKYWRVVERSSGQSFGNQAEKTQAAAIASAEKSLASVKPGLFDQVVRDSQKLNQATKPAETPVAAVAKVQEHVSDVASGAKPTAPKAQDSGLKTLPATGPRPAKEIKSELVQRLEAELKDAPDQPKILDDLQADLAKVDQYTRKGLARAGDFNRSRQAKALAPEAAKLFLKYGIEVIGKDKSGIGNKNPSISELRAKIDAELENYRSQIPKIDIQIPGDGAFRILNTKQALTEVLERAQKLNTSSGGRGYAEPARPGFNAEKWAAEAKAGRTLEQWADKQLAKDPRSRTRAGLDPAEEAVRLAAVAIKGSYVIARGVRDFAAWSAEMIRQLPELAQASAEQLRALYARAVDIAEGRDPEIGLSVRGMKVKADTSLSEEVRQNTEAAYAKRVSADDVAEAKRLVQAAGGPEAAARDMLSGLWKPVPDTVQVKGAGEILAGLAALERRANEIATQERLADLQVRIAEHSTAMATRPAQWLQAFASLYGNYTPAAWLKEWRKGIDAAAKTRIERATGKSTGNTAPEMAQDIAQGVAEGVRADAPTTAAVIEAVYGKGTARGDARPTAVEAVERIIGAKGEQAQRVAKKIQDFYEKEVNKFKKKHKIPELSPEDQRTVLAEAKAIERLPADSLQRREAVLKLLDSLHRRKGFEWWELPVSFWYANVLSGPTTHAKNILGNSVNLGMEAGLQSLLKPTNIPVILESLGRSLSVGAKEAWSILQTGHDTAARHGDKFELRRNPLELQSGGLDKVLLPWKLVGRLLRAEDAVFFNAGQELRAAILAKREAKGDTAAMREAMGWTADARAKAEAQATSEGLTGLNLQRRVNEIIEQGRSNDVMNAAREFGYDVTFNNEPYGVLGAFTSAINRGFDAAPVLKPFILPFTRIVANVSNSSLNWTPVGTYRALRGQRKLGWLGRAENSGKLYGREINDPLAIRDAHARAMLGTAAIIAVAAAAIKNVFDDEPEFMVTGSGPANKEQRDALRASGWIPYSVKIGGRYYSYADKPPQLALAMVGHYLDAVRYKNLNREDALNRLTYALNGNFAVLLQSSWLQGLSSLFNQANRDSTKGLTQGMVAQVTRTGSGFVVPSLLKQTDQFFDPQKYSPQDVQGMLMAQVPWARRTGQPDLNAFGQPVYSPTSKIFWSKPEGDTLVRKLAGARVFPGTPNQGDLTDKEHYALVKFRGPILREMLAERADEWVGAPRLIAQDIVNSISSTATEKAKAELGLDEANKERREFRKVTTK